MSDLARLPTRYQGKFSDLQDKVSSLTRRNSSLRQETKGKVGTVESVGLTQLGAALCGIGFARGWTEGSIGIAGGVLAAAGIFFGQSAAVHTANGVLAPLTAKMAGEWYAKSMTSGG